MSDEEPHVRLARHDERLKTLERAVLRIEEDGEKEITSVNARVDAFAARLWAAVLMAVGAALNAVSDILMRGGN